MTCLHSLIQSRTLLLSVALASAGWCSAVRADDGDSPKKDKPAARKAGVQGVRIRLQVRNLQIQVRKVQVAQPKKAKQVPARKVRIQRAIGFAPLAGFGYAGRSKIRMIRLAQVQKELKLTDAQKTKVAEVFNSHQKRVRGLFGGLQGLNADERRKKLTEVRKKIQTASAETDKAIDGVLKPEQTHRLGEILLQLQGLRALQDGSVAKRLKLTAEQKTKIADLFKSQTTKQQELNRGIRAKGLTPDQRRKKYKELRDKRLKLVKETDQNVTAVLTKAQQSQLKKMKGKEFKLDRRRMFRVVPQLKLKARPVGPKAAA